MISTTKRVLFSVLLLCVGLFSSTASADNGTSLIKFVNPDYMGVISVDFERFKDTKVFSDIWGLVEKEAGMEDFDKFSKATGFQLNKDLKTILISFPNDVDKNEEFIFIFEGNFPENKIIDYIKTQGETVNTVEYNGQTLYYDKLETDPHLCFVGKKYLLVGNLKTVKLALDTSASKKDILANANIKNIVDSTNKKSDAWGAFVLPQSMKDELALQEGPMAGKISSISGHVDFSKGINLLTNIFCDEKAAATELKTNLDKGLAEAAKDQQVQMLFGAYLKGIKFAQKDKTVSVTVELSQEELDTLVQFFKQMSQGPPQ